MNHTRIGVHPEGKVGSKEAEKDSDGGLHYMRNLKLSWEFPRSDTPIDDRGEILHKLARRFLLKDAAKEEHESKNGVGEGRPFATAPQREHELDE